MAEYEHWTCPHCGVIQVPSNNSSDSFNATANVGNFYELEEGYRSLFLSGSAVRCANSDCRRVTVTVRLSSMVRNANGGAEIGGGFLAEQLYPKPAGQPFPVGVPASLLEDYQEAWGVINLSPKSSATLARRCLQSMIRDFCSIQKPTLDQEIKELERRLGEDSLPRGVEPETIAAMQALRKIGNFAAHMTEVDGKIVDVDPGEAEALLGLIEMLFADWYVAKFRRAERLAAIEAIGMSKTAGGAKAAES